MGSVTHYLLMLSPRVTTPAVPLIETDAKSLYLGVSLPSQTIDIMRETIFPIIGQFDNDFS
jgi:hypothetical protein